MVSNVTANRGYQLPDATTKLKDDVLRVIAAFSAIDADIATLLLALAGKSNTGHGHGMDAIVGLIAALGNKLDVGYHDALANLADVDVAGVANGMALLRQASKWIPVALQINNIAGLEAALNGKATPADIAAAINALVGAAPGTLDTLNELAEALGDDPNFAATVTATLASVNTALANRLAYTAQVKTPAERAAARLNVDVGIVGGRRNKVDNPVFQVWQRGGSRIAAGYCADRWRVGTWGAGATGTLVSLSSENPIATQLGLRNIFAWDRTGGTTISRLIQSIEGAQTLSGREVTLAVMAYAVAPVTLPARVDQNFGSGGSGVVQGAIANLAITTVPTIFYHKFTMPSVAGKTFGASSCLEVILDSPAAGGFGIRLLGVALVDGDAVGEGQTIFGAADYTDELQHVQRFYEPGRSRYAAIPVSVGLNYFKDVPFKATKRVIPSMSFTLFDSAYFPGTPGGASDITQHGFTHLKTANGNDPRGYFSDDWAADAEFY